MPVSAGELRPGIIVRGPVFPEPLEILVVQPMGAEARLPVTGKSAGRIHRSVLNSPQHALLEATPQNEPSDSGAPRRRLGAASVHPKKLAR